MERLVLANRVKCSGCSAMQKNKSDYICNLGYPVVFHKTIHGVIFSPSPKEDVKCYKPIGEDSVETAKNLLLKRFPIFENDLDLSSLDSDRFKDLVATVNKLSYTTYLEIVKLDSEKIGNVKIHSYSNKEEAILIADNRPQLFIDVKNKKAVVKK